MVLPLGQKNLLDKRGRLLNNRSREQLFSLILPLGSSMKKYLLLAAVVLLIIAVGAYFLLRKNPEATYRTAKVERGVIVASVSATGNLSAVITVQVGTQVSGTIQRLYADFNSRVKKGQAIAQIEPALFNAQVEQTRGNYLSAEANLEKAKVTVADAKRTMERNRQLIKDGIISQSDFDTAQTAHDSALASLKSAEAVVIQTRGSYDQAQTNLRYTTICSPVDGIVVSRNVDVGQTVAASFQTPTLFTIAQDLTKMEIDTSVDEADIGRLREGQPVSFTVDAYPESRFVGTVRQIRNSPVITQNVVTYVVVIVVDNRDLKLKPGMTANVSIETARKENVLKIPSAALRFKPKGVKDAKEKPGGSEQHRLKKEVTQQVYLLGADSKPLPVAIKTGISNDGQLELVDGNIKENDEVIVEQLSTQKKSGGMGGPMGPRF
jgi:HlyD family secretion protein